MNSSSLGGDVEHIRERFVRRRKLAREREVDEILADRREVAHYYTGVADAYDEILAALEGGDA